MRGGTCSVSADLVEGQVGPDSVAGAEEHEVVALFLAGEVVERRCPEFRLTLQILHAQSSMEPTRTFAITGLLLSHQRHSTHAVILAPCALLGSARASFRTRSSSSRFVERRVDAVLLSAYP